LDRRRQKRGELIGYDGYHRKKGTKVHVAVTPASLPVSVMIGRGNEHESRKLIPLMEGVSVKAPHRRGRPRKRPWRVHADKNYDTFLVRLYLQRRHIRANIPSRSRKKRQGRPTIFDEHALKKTRYTVERFFSWMKSFRRIDTRYDRLVSSFMGFIRIACSLILMREVLR
ncbi:MAG: IS5 family transposase, partial [Thaumarchaeota archaeon]